MALVGSGLAAQDSVIVVGGVGSFGSNGSNPGTLSDGTTKATARLVFHWDAAASELTLTVENTSPVTSGVATPVLTDVFFNVPAGVTGLTLQSQSAAGGAAPNFALVFDDDLSSDPNPNAANGFGAYNALLATSGGGAQGGISNPDADTLGIPPGTEVVGPATFVFAATGNLAAVTAFDFNSLVSANPPGSQSFVGAAKFQAGGAAGASGFISPSGSFCSTAAVVEDLGGGCGGPQLSSGLPIMGELTTVTITNLPVGSCGTGYGSLPGATPFLYKTCLVFLDRNPNSLFVIQNFKAELTNEVSCNVRPPSFQQSPNCCGVSFILQGLVIDNSAPVGERVSVTNGLFITLGS
jgi:hypothetical protein